MAPLRAHGSNSYRTKGFKFEFDVFISFRGEDTRYGFTGYLYDALIREKIKTFMDDEGLRRGDEISPALIKAIERSRMSVIVFSEDYASSRWCLDELVTIFECMKLRGQLALPVFYKVDPSMIRHQSDPYGKSMAELEQRFKDNPNKTKIWRSVLRQAANLPGWHVESGYEFQFIQRIVKDVFRRLNGPSLPVSANPVGRESHTSQVASQLGLLLDGGFGLTGVCEKKNGERSIKADGVRKYADDLLFFGSSRLFDFEGLVRASAEVLGKGTFATTFKAVLETGLVLAVKELTDVKLCNSEFQERIEIFRAMDHDNLVSLRAYYHSGSKKFLVYDYMPMGSLSALLHGRKGTGTAPLNWERRLTIALGVARGIKYLHSHGPNISHGNIKSSNILLTKSYEARLADFCLPLLVGPSSALATVPGYHAPEVLDPRKVSQKADVYSFGVLLLEILTGRVPIDSLLTEEEISLHSWVQSIDVEDWTSEVFDLGLRRCQDAQEDMSQLLQLAVNCTAPCPDKRPSISAVTKRIKELQQSTVQNDSSGFRGKKPVYDVRNCAMGQDVKEAAAIERKTKDLVFFGNSSRMLNNEGLMKASEVLGRGSFGTAYKAVLENGIVVTVKDLKDVKILRRELQKRIETVGAMVHDHLVPLVAYDSRFGKFLLVYDYMPMGSLSANLRGNQNRTPLNWKTRLSIALGAARGIEYVHSQGPDVAHGNIKPSNVLLTKLNEACVSDYCLAMLFGPSSTPTRVAAYYAPEVVDPLKVSQKADVYSFGALLLELLTGKSPVDPFMNEERIDLLQLVKNIDRKKWAADMFDYELLRNPKVEEEMFELLQLAVDCSAPYPDKRPTMSEVAMRIEQLTM